MIVSASYRTDIPAFYGDWFMNRLDAGFCRVASPYGGPPYDVALAGPAVDGFVFWTKNAGPFLPVLGEVRRRGHPFVVQYTITGYPRALEHSVTDAERAVGHVRTLAGEYGSRAVVWRYDPVLISSLTPPAWHRAAFARLAAALGGHCDEVVTSFAQIYRKTARNLDAAARRHGFDWRDPDDADKLALLNDMAVIAADNGMALTLCSQPALLGPGLAPSRCIDAGRLSDVAGRPLAARTKGNRPGCLCAESRDIGAYDTCPHGCAYCYAVRHRDAARCAFKGHDPSAPALAPMSARDRPAV
ncbi:MAG: DUF1848 domain-containing protein [Alphaproteobacteria bacterium]